VSYEWYTEKVKSFIKSNLYSDTNHLILNPPKEFRTDIVAISEQIISRKKAQKKFPEWFQNLDLIMPPPLSIEQASSSATADFKKKLISGENLVDLTGGMGIDSIHLSANFQESFYVEIDPKISDVFSFNSSVLNRKIKVQNTSAEDFLKNYERKDTCFFIDPARRNAGKKVFLIEDCEPDILQLIPALNLEENSALIKLSPMVDIKNIIKKLPFLASIYVVSLRNEVKEVLAHLKNMDEKEPKINCVNLESCHPDFAFTLSTESKSIVNYCAPKEYLFEPNNSILKAGAFKSIAKQFGLEKIAPNTHIYTSDNLVSDFPGKTFKIKNLASKKSIKRRVPNGYINVILRNYPGDTATFKKKWKINDGGEMYLIGFRDSSNTTYHFLSEKISH